MLMVENNIYIYTLYIK